MTEAFVARFSPAGELRWAKRYGDIGANAFAGVAVMNDAVYIGGYYSGSPNLGTGALPDRGNNEALVLRMGATTPAVDWVSTFGGVNNQRVYNVTLHDNAVVGAGYYAGTIDLPGMPPAERADGLVVAYDTTDGTLVDAYRYGGPNCDFLQSAHTADGHVIAAGTFQDTITLDTPVTSAGLSDSVAFGVDGDGVQWHRAFGDTTDEIATSTAGGLSTALYVGGARNIQLDIGCFRVMGTMTGYIRRY